MPSQTMIVRRAVVVFVLLLSPVAAWAQGVGVRAGVSADPDQFYFGLHDEVGPVVDHLWFRPNLEVGLGNDETVVCANIEFAYHLSPFNRRSDWQLYLGGGPALNIFTANGESDLGGGFNLMVGLMHRRGLFTELKIGLGDSPGLKFGVGYTFH